MVGSSVARLPGVMAAAAALATAATTADFPQMLNSKGSTMLFYSAHSTIISATSSTFATPSDMSYPSLPLAQGAGSIIKPPSVFHPSHKVLSHLLPLSLSSSVTSSAHVFCTQLNGSASLSNSSTLRPCLACPPYLYRSPRDHLHRFFQSQAINSLPFSSSIASSAQHLPTSLSSNQSSPYIFCRSSSMPDSDLSSHLATFFSAFASPASPAHPTASSWNSMHTWHTPKPGFSDPREVKGGSGTSPTDKPALTVVLLGWLGSQQKHLRKYAEWYNARGIHAVTFTVPMADLLSITLGGKAEAHVDELTDRLAMWLEEDCKVNRSVEKHLIFHTFSNTGWLTYGVVLEKLLAGRKDLVEKIKGCVVDSAPSPEPDPQVWASGFSAALLKKRSIAAKGLVQDLASPDATELVHEKVQPHVAEAALLAMLEKFFTFFLQIPAINQRLAQVVNVLSKQQPPCPQLYIYSTADKVIPAKQVESFIEKQRQTGRVVRACNLHSSPHVDHFRSFPEIYGKQVSNFLEECSPKSSRDRMEGACP